MTFDKDQMVILSKFEDYFYTAVNAAWARNPGRYNLQVIHTIFCGATGDKRRLDANCQHCILNLLRDTGKLYFQDKETIAKAEENTKEVKAEDLPAKKVRAKVKTKK